MYVDELFQPKKPQFTKVGLGNWLIREAGGNNYQVLMTFTKPHSAYVTPCNKTVAPMVYYHQSSRLEAWGGEVVVQNYDSFSKRELETIFQHTAMNEWRILTNEEAAQYLAKIPTPH